jgi:hypothetical protein
MLSYLHKQAKQKRHVRVRAVRFSHDKVEQIVVRHIQQRVQCHDLGRVERLQVALQEAAQDEIQFEQAAATAPAYPFPLLRGLQSLRQSVSPEAA